MGGIIIPGQGDDDRTDRYETLRHELMLASDPRPGWRIGGFVTATVFVPEAAQAGEQVVGAQFELLVWPYNRELDILHSALSLMQRRYVELVQEREEAEGGEDDEESDPAQD